MGRRRSLAPLGAGYLEMAGVISAVDKKVQKKLLMRVQLHGKGANKPLESPQNPQPNLGSVTRLVL